MSSDGLHLKDWQFKPGESGNPGGRPALTEEEKKVKKLTQQQYIDAMNKIYTMGTYEEVQRAISKENIGKLEPFEAIVMRQWVYCASKGDPKAFEYILTRLIGAPAKKIELSGNSLMELFDNEPEVT
jgi:hypothetical protein